MSQPSWKSRHVMIDIETLSTQPNATILSIGACPVFPEEHLDLADFYHEIHPNQRRHIETKTISWWMDQPTKPPMNGISLLSESLWALRSWIVHRFYEDPIIWANGTDFDITVLSDAYRDLGVGVVPWKYNNVRDFRTVSKLFPIEMSDSDSKHNALADAKWQAAKLRLICERYALELA